MKQDLAGSSSPIHVAAAARSEAVAAAADPAASSQQQHQGSSSKSNSSMGNQGKQKEEGCILISSAATQTSDISRIPQSATRRRRERPIGPSPPTRPQLSPSIPGMAIPTTYATIPHQPWSQYLLYTKRQHKYFVRSERENAYVAFVLKKLNICYAFCV